jgi:hypothetical protein
MSLISWANSKLNKLDSIDMAFVKISCFAFGIILARLIPVLTEINIWWFVILWIALAIKPLFKFFSR